MPLIPASLPFSHNKSAVAEPSSSPPMRPLIRNPVEEPPFGRDGSRTFLPRLPTLDSLLPSRGCSDPPPGFGMTGVKSSIATSAPSHTRTASIQSVMRILRPVRQSVLLYGSVASRATSTSTPFGQTDAALGRPNWTTSQSSAATRSRMRPLLKVSSSQPVSLIRSMCLSLSRCRSNSQYFMCGRR